MNPVPEWQRQSFDPDSSEDEAWMGTQHSSTMSVDKKLGPSPSAHSVPTVEELLGSSHGGDARPPGSVLSRVIARAEVIKPVPGRSHEVADEEAKAKDDGHKPQRSKRPSIGSPQEDEAWRTAHSVSGAKKARRWTKFIQTSGAAPQSPVRSASDSPSPQTPMSPGGYFPDSESPAGEIPPSIAPVKPGIPLSQTRLRIHRHRQNDAALKRLRQAASTAMATIRLRRFVRIARERRAQRQMAGAHADFPGTKRRSSSAGITFVEKGPTAASMPAPAMSIKPTFADVTGSPMMSAPPPTKHEGAPSLAMILRRQDARSRQSGETPLYRLFKNAVQTGRLPPVCNAASVFQGAHASTGGGERPGEVAQREMEAMTRLEHSLDTVVKPKLIHPVCYYDAAKYKEPAGRIRRPAPGPLRRLFDTYARLLSAGAQLSGMGKESLTYDMRAYAQHTMSVGELLFLLRDIEVVPQLLSRLEAQWVFDRRSHPPKMPSTSLPPQAHAGYRAVASLTSGASGRFNPPIDDEAGVFDPLMEELGWTLEDATIEDQLRQQDLDFRRFCRVFIRVALFAMSKPSIALSSLGLPGVTFDAAGHPILRKRPGDDSIDLPGQEQDISLFPLPSDSIDPLSSKVSPQARELFTSMGLTPALARRRILASPACKVRRFIRHTRLNSPSYVTHLLSTVSKETDDMLNAPGPPSSDMDRSSYLPQQSGMVTSAKRAVAALHARRTRLFNARGALLVDDEGRAIDTQWRGGASSTSIGAIAYQTSRGGWDVATAAPELDLHTIRDASRLGGSHLPLPNEEKEQYDREDVHEGGDMEVVLPPDDDDSSSDDDLGWEEGRETKKPWGGLGGPYPEPRRVSSHVRDGESSVASSVELEHPLKSALRKTSKTTSSQGVRFTREAVPAHRSGGRTDASAFALTDPYAAANMALDGDASAGIARSVIASRGYLALDPSAASAMQKHKRGKILTEYDDGPTALRKTRSSTNVSDSAMIALDVAATVAPLWSAVSSKHQKPPPSNTVSSPDLPIAHQKQRQMQSLRLSTPVDRGTSGPLPAIGPPNPPRSPKGGHSFQRLSKRPQLSPTTAGSTGAGYLEDSLGGRLQGRDRVGSVVSLISAGADIESGPSSPTSSAKRSAHSAVPRSRLGRQSVHSAFHMGSTIIAASVARSISPSSDAGQSVEGQSRKLPKATVTVSAGTAEEALEMVGLWNPGAVARLHKALPPRDMAGGVTLGTGEWRSSALAGRVATAERRAREKLLREERSLGIAQGTLGVTASATALLDPEGARSKLVRRTTASLTSSTPDLWRAAMGSTTGGLLTQASRTWKESGAIHFGMSSDSASLMGGPTGNTLSQSSSATLSAPGLAFAVGPEHAAVRSYDPRLLGLLAAMSQDPNARRWTCYAPSVGAMFMDLGRVLVGKAYEFRIEVRNISGGNLRIVAEKVGMPGVALRYKARPLAAGMTAVVDLQLIALQPCELIGHVILSCLCGDGRAEASVCPCYVRAVLPGSIAAKLADMPPAIATVPLGVGES
jgi:hypothetical protein